MLGLILPFGFLLSAMRRRPRSRRKLAQDPRRVSGRACCSACARDQRLGTMPVGTTCTPCAAAHGIPATDCTVMPFAVDLVDQAIAGLPPGLDPHDATTSVLLAVYGFDEQGQLIPWERLPDRASWCLHVLRSRVHARVCVGLATLADLASDASWTAAGYPRVPAGTGKVVR